MLFRDTFPANKKLFATSFILLLVLTGLKQKRNFTEEILLKSVFILKLLDNSLASCSLINFDILLSHTAYFDKNITLSFFCPCYFSIFNSSWLITEPINALEATNMIRLKRITSKGLT